MEIVRHYLSDLDLTVDEHAKVLARAAEMKAAPDDFSHTLHRKILAMIFQKASTRTRVSFEAGMIQLGGQAIILSAGDIQLGRGEPITDTGAVLSRYVDAVTIRAFAHQDVIDLASSATVPVINALDDLLHPCQSLADLLTIREQKGALGGMQLVYVGDGNNVARSLMYAGARTGLHVRVVTPAGFEPEREIVTTAQAEAAATAANIEVTNDLDGVEGADVVYTDVWASMGQEEDLARRRKAFNGFRVNTALMQKAKSDAIFLHCLPAHRGEEVSARVIDGPKSRVFDQAENRMHTQKALLDFLLNGLW